MSIIYNNARVVEVESDYEGQRLDNFLMRLVKNVPKSRIYQMMRKGEVRVNGGRKKANYHLIQGDKVRVPPVHTSKTIALQPSNHYVELLAKNILFEDAQMLVLNKPAGLAVHGGTGEHYGVIDILKQLYDKNAFLELGHRLDKETSGCLVIAKKRSFLKYFQNLLRAHQIEKTYEMIVYGKWPQSITQVNKPLLKRILPNQEHKVFIDKDGKPSVTEFKIITEYKQATLLEAQLITGRTHQIRVHCYSVGNPILGDNKYYNESSKQLFQALKGKQLLLHSKCISIPRENTEPAIIEAPRSHALNQMIKVLEK